MSRIRTGNRDRNGLYGYLTAFFLPVLVLTLVFIQRGIFPFGEQCYLRTDMYHQYAPFFSEFRHKLTEGGSLLYSWNVGLGVNFSAIYAYYLASPVNWLILLCPKHFIIEFMTIMIVVKTALCAVTMTWYLNRKGEGRHYYSCLFGIFYAMSGYMCAYSWNIMWLDCILLFPIIMFGMEELTVNGRMLPYTVALGLSICSNYYISIMICIFLVFWFFSRMVLDASGARHFVSAGLRFAVGSLAAGGLSAAILIPEVFALRSTASGNFTFPQTFNAYFSILDMLARHIGNIETEIGLDHWPNIYCGIAVILLLPLYFANRRISLKEKAVYGTMFVFMLAGFSINVLNYIWHGFHYPNSLPCRQSFIYIFLVLFCAFRTWEQRAGLTVRDYKAAFILGFGFILFCQKFVDQKHFEFWTYYAALAFFCVYALVLWLLFVNRINAKRAAVVLVFLAAAETLANTAYSSVPTTSRTEYLRNCDEVELLVAENADKPFARYDMVERKTKDDGAYMHYPSVSLFSSTANKAISDFMRNVGCESSVNAYSIIGATPLVDSLLSVRYAFYENEPDNETLTFISESGGTLLYENPDVLPLGFTISSDLEENWLYDLQNPAEVQNDLAAVLRTKAPLIEVDDAVRDGIRCSFDIQSGGLYYAYIPDGKVNTVNVDLPSGKKKFENLSRHYFMELGMLYAGEYITFRGDDEDGISNLDVKLYRFDHDALKELTDILGREPFEITDFSDDRIEGTITTDNVSTLLFSIPYDKGWKVLVDGKETGTKSCFEAFLSVPLYPGTHSVILKYEPEGRKIGLIISAAAFIFIILIGLFDHYSKKPAYEYPEDEEWEEEDDELIGEAEEEAEKVNEAEKAEETKEAEETAEAGKAETQATVAENEDEETEDDISVLDEDFG